MSETSVKELDDNTWKTELESQPLALVDVYASWCGPCRLFAPTFAKVSEDYPQIAFYKIDGDANPSVREGLTIDNLPYVAVFKNGKFEQGFSTSNEAGLREFIEKVKDS